MSFCPNCGTKNDESSKFCCYCGEKLATTNSVVSDERYPEKRQIRFASDLLKCPSCGREVDDSTIVCPACGYKFVGITVSPEVEQFIAQVKNLENKRLSYHSGKKKESVVFWLLLVLPATFFVFSMFLAASSAGGFGIAIIVFRMVLLLLFTLLIYFAVDSLTKLKLSNYDSAELQYIESYNFTYTKKITLELLYYIHSIVSGLSSRFNSAYNEYWINVWREKASVIYSHSMQHFKSDSQIDSVYNQITDIATNTRYNKSIKKFGLLIAVSIEIISMMLVILLPPIKKSNVVTNPNIRYGYWLNDNFVSGDSGVSVELTNDQYILISVDVICEKSLRGEIQLFLEDKGIVTDQWSVVSGVMMITSENELHIGTGSINQQNCLAFVNSLIDMNVGDEAVLQFSIRPAQWQQYFYRDCINTDFIFIQMSLVVEYIDADGNWGQIEIDYNGTEKVKATVGTNNTLSSV